MSTTIENTNKLINFIGNKIHLGELDNNSIVQLIELCGLYLNIQTISDYAKINNLSYNGVKKHRNIKELFNVKFVIDNI